MPEPQIRYPCPVRRLHVVWHDGEWSIDDEILVPSMTLPASDELPDVEAISGFWWELVDGEGRTIYRHMLVDPFATHVECFDVGGRISPVPAEPPERMAFDVAIPDVGGAAELHFYSSSTPGRPDEPMRPAERIAALDVRSIRGGGDGRQ